MRGSSVSDTAVLGSGLVVRGRVHGDRDLHIEATIEGDVEVAGNLQLGAAAVVEGRLNAASVVIEGSLSGDIESAGPVALVSGANVRGNVQASELSIEEGATFVGRVDADFELPDLLR